MSTYTLISQWLLSLYSNPSHGSIAEHEFTGSSVGASKHLSRIQDEPQAIIGQVLVRRLRCSPLRDSDLCRAVEETA
jgi:hypothetical protein